MLLLFQYSMCIQICWCFIHTYLPIELLWIHFWRDDFAHKWGSSWSSGSGCSSRSNSSINLSNWCNNDASLCWGIPCTNSVWGHTVYDVDSERHYSKKKETSMQPSLCYHRLCHNSIYCSSDVSGAWSCTFLVPFCWKFLLGNFSHLVLLHRQETCFRCHPNLQKI